MSAWLGACGGDDEPSPAPTPASSTGQDAAASEPTTKAAGPKITQIMKMTGGLHVVWELPATCDGVELERKDADAEYKVAYTLPGTVDNKHDGTATANMLYTYRARCKVGAEYTEYSNEMSKNPK